MPRLIFPPLRHTPSRIFMYRNILMAMFSPSAFSNPSKPGLLLTSQILYVFLGQRQTQTQTQSSSGCGLDAAREVCVLALGRVCDCV